jgi:hypothetical protein
MPFARAARARAPAKSPQFERNKKCTHRHYNLRKNANGASGKHRPHTGNTTCQRLIERLRGQKIFSQRA